MTDPQSKDEQAMRPCPKCGEPVHPENTGFHVCTLTSNLVSRLRQAGIYLDERKQTATDKLLCEAADEIERLTQQLFEARNDLDRLHDIMRGERAAPESRDG